MHSECPLATLPLANRPLLDHALDTLLDAGVVEVALIVDREIATEVRQIVDSRDAGPELTWIERQSDQGFAAAVDLAGDFLAGEGCVVHLGDSLTRTPLSGVLGSALAGPNDSVQLLRSDAPDLGGVRPLFSAEHTERGSMPREEHVGIYFLGSGLEAAAAASSSNARLDHEVLDVICKLTERGGRRGVVELEDSWRYQPRSRNLLQGNRFALESLKPAVLRGELGGQ